MANKKQNTNNKQNEKNKKQQTKTENLSENKKQQSQKQDTKASEDLELKLKECEEKINELNDKYLRLAAEYDNFRKRTLKEKMELVKTAGEDIFKSLLPVIDNFERALDALKEAKDIEAVKEGVFHIYKGFLDFLEKNNVKEIDALGKPLDTDLHEAVAQAPAPEDDKKGKIIDVVQKGYKLHDKVIRHAKVVVGN